MRQVREVREVRRRTGALGALGAIASRGLVAILIASAGVYLHHHVRIAGGLDSYGYVSTAKLIAAGRLSEPQPLAQVLPFENALSAATPLGHVPRADGEASVPRFPIGLPLVMAAFSVFGPQGPFFVPLVMALAALALMFALTLAAPLSMLAGPHPRSLSFGGASTTRFPPAPHSGRGRYAPDAPNAPIAPSHLYWLQPC